MPFRAWGIFLLSFSLLSSSFAAGVGEAAPELKVKEWLNTTTPLTLSSLKDKVVVVEFWATWCGPCVELIPHVIELQNKYKNKDVVVIGLTTQKKDAKLEKFVKEHGMTYAVGTGTASLNDYAVSTIPSAFVISRGEIFWRGRPDSGLDVALQAALRANKTPAKPAAEVKLPTPPETKAAVVEAPAPAPTPEKPAAPAAPIAQNAPAAPTTPAAPFTADVTPPTPTAPVAQPAPSTEILHEVVYVMKDGRRIEADQAVESGEEWAVKDKAGKYQMLKKSDVAEMKM